MFHIGDGGAKNNSYEGVFKLHVRVVAIALVANNTSSNI